MEGLYFFSFQVVSVMGKQFALQILVMTESIEEEGGMSTAGNLLRVSMHETESYVWRKA